MIGGLRVLDTDTLSATAQTMALLPSQDALQTARIYGHNAATWYGLTVELGYSTVILLHAREGYIGTTGRDIRIGSTMQEVRHAYGDPAYLVAGRQGTYHVYQQNQIVFHSNADNKVSGWMLYGIEE
jgi:hypothetical protein